jgi:ABC-type glycerol-3-phosphate transport system substrate-binding protein
MRRIHAGTVVLALVFGGACSGNKAATGAAPLDEYLCSGRNSVGDVTERVEAASREEAAAKFKKKHTDVPVATCRPNPRQ